MLLCRLNLWLSSSLSFSTFLSISRSFVPAVRSVGVAWLNCGCSTTRFVVPSPICCRLCLDCRHWGSSGSLRLLEIPSSPAIEQYQSEIIIESSQTCIEEGQVYQDKKTIVAAMKNYAVMQKFQFRVKRSSCRRFVLSCSFSMLKYYFYLCSCIQL